MSDPTSVVKAAPFVMTQTPQPGGGGKIAYPPVGSTGRLPATLRVGTSRLAKHTPFASKVEKPVAPTTLFAGQPVSKEKPPAAGVVDAQHAAWWKSRSFLVMLVVMLVIVGIVAAIYLWTRGNKSAPSVTSSAAERRLTSGSAFAAGASAQSFSTSPTTTWTTVNQVNWDAFCRGHRGQRILLFLRMETCGACNMMVPILEKIMNDGSARDMVFAQSLAHDPQSLAAMYNPDGRYPTFVLFDANGNEVRRLTGARPEDVFRAFLFAA